MVNHIVQSIYSLPRRPVVVFVGDGQQQQPISDTGTEANLLNDDELRKLCIKFNLLHQYRCIDPALQSFLHLIRYTQPTQKQIDQYCSDRSLLTYGDPSDALIMDAYNKDPDTTFITVTNYGADRINSIVVQALFENETILAYVRLANEQEHRRLYTNIRLVITENRCKKSGIVNGQICTLVRREGKSLFVRLKNGKINVIYPVTNERKYTYYPLRLAYAITVYKAQGKTLPSATIWFDREILSEGCGYVAVSRVKRLTNMTFLVKPVPSHFRAVIL